MIAYQIVIKGNARSEEYARLSRESFQPAIDAGHLSEIRIFDAITPDSPSYQEHVDKYKFVTSIMIGDLKSGKNQDDHSPSEKAGMCSHWELMRMQTEQEEQFFIMEHDTYLIPEHLDVFGDMVEFLKTDKPHYMNIGLFMGCYTYSMYAARFMYDLLVNKSFPINCGPYCTLQRLFRTYTTSVLVKEDNHGNRVTVVHPWTQCETLGFGTECGVYFNKPDLDIPNSVPNPTTQMISKSMKVTQDHHGYIDRHVDSPWTRHNYFHIID